jgi:hypothetical protein
MMDDYVFLEDVGQRVGGWGWEIIQGGFGSTNVGKGSSMRAGQSKRDILKMQLEAKDIQVNLLPLGMHKWKLSTFSVSAGVIYQHQLARTVMLRTDRGWSLS